MGQSPRARRRRGTSTCWPSVPTSTIPGSSITLPITRLHFGVSMRRVLYAMEFRSTPTIWAKTERRPPFSVAVATELRHSLGARLWRPIAKKEPGLDFDYEGVVQFGTFGSDDIRAWTFASETGYSFTSLPLRPRFSVKADISSGDDPRGHTLGTFYPVFPIGNYFGVLADTGPGPVNFIDVHPRIQLQLPHDVSVSDGLGRSVAREHE